MLTVRVPGSSANLGPGFDALGLALAVSLDVTVATQDEPITPVDAHHPAARAHRAAGGDGRVAVRSAIPAGRGLGFSGAARVGGALAALCTADARRDPSDASDGDLIGDDLRAEAIRIATVLEGHPDNAAASALGGFTVAAAGTALRVPLPIEACVVVWVPETETSTRRSRGTLPTTVPFADAAFNVGRASLLVAALATGRSDVLRAATADRLHQDPRLALVPESRAALDAALDSGAWCAWLSGSGPTIAALVEPGASAEAVRAALPPTGRARIVDIDRDGARVHRQAVDST